MRCNGRQIARAPQTARIAAVLLAVSFFLAAASAASAVEIRAGTVLPDEWGLTDLGLVKIQDDPTTFEVRADADFLNISLFVYDDSVVNIYGGTVNGFVVANDSSTINVYGGFVAADEDIEAKGNGTVNLFGGHFGDDIEASESGVVNLHGGTFDKARDGATLSVQHNGIVNVYGTSFEFEPPGPTFRSLTGFLSDGSPLNVEVYEDSCCPGAGGVVLHAIPEPPAHTLLLIAVPALLVVRRVSALVKTTSLRA